MVKCVHLHNNASPENISHTKEHEQSNNFKKVKSCKIDEEMSAALGMFN